MRATKFPPFSKEGVCNQLQEWKEKKTYKLIFTIFLFSLIACRRTLIINIAVRNEEGKYSAKQSCSDSDGKCLFVC